MYKYVSCEQSVKKIAISCLALLSTACCMFGTYEGQESVWTALKDPRPITSSQIQLESCFVEDKKQCAENYATACRDLAGSENKVELINQTTGKPLSQAERGRMQTTCENIKSKPEYIDNVCQIPRGVDSCMQKNGYKHEYKTTTQCSSMKLL